jgi:hypothetical protein
MKVALKNARNVIIPTIHPFASRIMSSVDSYVCSPHIYVEYFGTPTRVSSLRLN